MSLCSNNNLINKIKKHLIIIYEYYYEKKRIMKLRFWYRLRIMSSSKTLDYIYKKKCSVARFGDGEFDLMLGLRDLRFQIKSNKIAEDLTKVIDNKNPSLLICIPRCLNSLIGMDKIAKDFWIPWGKNRHQEQVVDFLWSKLGKDYCYGDAYISRPYINYKNKRHADTVFKNLKQIWKDRNLLIVEGEQTRLGVGNDLFELANGIKRILVPSLNAYEKIDEIEQEILKWHSDELVLLAIGPTATILASVLSGNGIQAIDIGHVDIEYEWYLSGTREKTAIKGKYVNEIAEGRVFQNCTDSAYLSQIISRVL